MPYVDAFFDRDSDIIRVVERKDGKRHFHEYQSKYTFYYEDPRGKYKSIYGNTLSRIVCKNTKDFRKELAINKGKNLFESDINPIFQCLSENYLNVDSPKLNVAFFDIETDFAVTDTVFLVDQLFRGHWSVSEAASYFEGMRPSVAVKQELFLDAEKYLKFRLAKMIRHTNEFMGHVFSDKDEKATSKEKFRIAIEESQRLTTEWNSLKDQLKSLKKFVYQV